MVTLSRGDIWLAQFDESPNCSPQNTRLCVIVSPDEMHRYLQTAMVAPMTTRTQVAPFRVPITFDGKTGLILLDQIRTLDKTRLLINKGKINVLDDVIEVLQEIFAK